ncbi:MAG: helix-turn-helix transcriptional regulator [Elusimicrobiota bacterium]|jgi:transcriptional regulator with XRE-family HTH domain
MALYKWARKDLALRVKAWRRKLGLSLREAAGIINIQFTTLARVERAVQDPSAETLLRLMDWFDIHPCALLRRDR